MLILLVRWDVRLRTTSLCDYLEQHLLIISVTRLAFQERLAFELGLSDRWIILGDIRKGS